MRICRFSTGEEPRFGVVTGEVDEFGQPAEDSVVVALRRGDTPILSAGFSGSRRPLTDGQLLRAFVTHPLLTWKVTAGIHWEALKMMFKGARYRHRGPVPVRAVTTGHSL